MTHKPTYVGDNSYQPHARQSQATFRFQNVQDQRSSSKLIQQVETACNAGIIDIVIDMSEAHLLKPNGLKALNQISSFLQEKAAAEHLRQSRRRRRKTMKLIPATKVRLLNPSPAVRHILNASGIEGFIDVYGDI